MACDRKLIQIINGENVTIIDELIPCFTDDNTFTKENKGHEITRILPAQWSELPDGFFKSSLDYDTRYIIKSLTIDEKWTEKIPTVKLQTDMEFRRNLDQALVLSNIKTIYGSAFYQNLVNLAFYTLTLFVFLLICLKFIQINRNINTLKNKEIKTIMQEHVDKSENKS